MGKKYTVAPVYWSKGQLDNIGKPNYGGVAAAMSSTGYKQIRTKPAGGKQ